MKDGVGTNGFLFIFVHEKRLRTRKVKKQECELLQCLVVRTPT